MDKGTSDERLLKIIEGGAGEARRKPNIGISSKKPLSGMAPATKSKFSFKDLREIKLNLSAINQGLIAAAALVTLLFLYGLFSGPSVSASSASYFSAGDAASVAKAISAQEAQGTPARKNILSQDFKRNIFLAPGATPTQSAEADGPKVAELVKDIRLVGIIWSTDPEVMIEAGKDPATSRTYVLKKGETFESDQFRVKEVSRNSATLEISSGGKTSDYELR